MNIYQFYYNNFLPESNINILGDKCQVVSLGIHALPGSKFYINESDKPIIINSNGNISINCEKFPIISIKIDENNNIKTTPIIIDVIYKGVIESV